VVAVILADTNADLLDRPSPACVLGAVGPASLSALSGFPPANWLQAEILQGVGATRQIDKLTVGGLSAFLEHPHVAVVLPGVPLLLPLDQRGVSQSLRRFQIAIVPLEDKPPRGVNVGRVEGHGIEAAVLVRQSAKSGGVETVHQSLVPNPGDDQRPSQDPRERSRGLRSRPAQPQSLGAVVSLVRRVRMAGGLVRYRGVLPYGISCFSSSLPATSRALLLIWSCCGRSASKSQTTGTWAR